jgi:hypothetical protein
MQPGSSERRGRGDDVIAEHGQLTATIAAGELVMHAG